MSCFILIQLSPLQVKGKGKMETFWVGEIQPEDNEANTALLLWKNAHSSISTGGPYIGRRIQDCQGIAHCSKREENETTIDSQKTSSGVSFAAQATAQQYSQPTSASERSTGSGLQVPWESSTGILLQATTSCHTQCSPFSSTERDPQQFLTTGIKSRTDSSCNPSRRLQLLDRSARCRVSPSLKIGDFGEGHNLPASILLDYGARRASAPAAQLAPSGMDLLEIKSEKLWARAPAWS